MATNRRHPEGKNSPQAQRARRLRKAVGIGTSREFAEWLGITESRWNNFETGYPISSSVIDRLVMRIDGLTADYVRYGKTGFLPNELMRKLGELPSGKPRSPNGKPRISPASVPPPRDRAR